MTSDIKIFFADNIVSPLKNAGFLRLFILFTVFLLMSGPPGLREVVIETLSEAYIAVSSFVAATLALFFFLESVFKINIEDKMEKAEKWQVFFSALIGALPGCGGAIIIVTQYARGKLSFGSLVAVLIATMGDAAFLLLAQEPLTGLMIFVLGFIVGTITGYAVDAIHGYGFMRRSRAIDERHTNLEDKSGFVTADYLWIMFIIPGFMLGLANTFQVEADTWLGFPGMESPSVYFGAAGALLCLLMWNFRHVSQTHPGFGNEMDAYEFGKTVCVSDGAKACAAESETRVGQKSLHPLIRVIMDTNFVTAWVVMAFLGYELSVYFLDLDLAGFFETWAFLIPSVAILIGFIPGCGPQVLITTLYVEGLIPLSAQIANAISNDGDALFPAIALAPRAAILATLYSAVPAFFVGYGVYWFLGK